MMLWAIPLVSAIAGSLIAVAGSRAGRTGLGACAVGSLAIVLGLAIGAVLLDQGGAFAWGPGMALTVGLDPMVAVAVILIPAIAMPVIAWAAAVEERRGLARLLGLLVVFVGAMELLVAAADLLTLAVAWELVGAVSWALIAHRWRDRENTDAAGYALVATRAGGLGLWLAAGAALASTGGFAFDSLREVGGGWQHLMAAGILIAAAAKSAQGPFAPWLFRAMHGPSSVSALLHASTMVAAGAWILIRLHRPLEAVAWFGPAAIAVGLVTAIAGGAVALLQRHPKRLLAASTSAHYGLMFAAVGAGFAGAGLAHLVAHAFFKALLFLAAGSAMVAAGRRLPWIAAASFVGALALAGVPPLGGAWTKDQIVAVTGHVSVWLALVAIAAGALSAAYAARFQWMVFGGAGLLAPSPQRGEGWGGGRLAERGAVLILAAISIALGALWLPGAESVIAGATAPTKIWELALSVATVVAGLAIGVVAERRRWIPETGAADWLGLPALIDAAVVEPTRRLARGCARFDDRAVDAGVRAAAAIAAALSRFTARLVEIGIDGAVRGVARGTLGAARRSRAADDRGIDTAVETVAGGVGAAGERSRDLQTGALPTYYTLLAAGLLVLLVGLAIWS